MRALFIGGVVDNSEMDLDGNQPPVHYPENSGSGRPRYRLHLVGQRDDGSIAYAVYGAPDLDEGEVERVADERGYARRFEAKTAPALSGRAMQGDANPYRAPGDHAKD